MPGLNEPCERFQAIQFHAVFEQSIIPVMDRAGLVHQLKSSPSLHGNKLIDALFDDIEAIILYYTTWNFPS